MLNLTYFNLISFLKQQWLWQFSWQSNVSPWLSVTYKFNTRTSEFLIRCAPFYLRPWHSFGQWKNILLLLCNSVCRLANRCPKPFQLFNLNLRQHLIQIRKVCCRSIFYNVVCNRINNINFSKRYTYSCICPWSMKFWLVPVN